MNNSRAQPGMPSSHLICSKPWMFWSGPVGKPTWGMQYSFRGHMAAICDEWTASHGVAFTEGFKRLNLGKVIGKSGNSGYSTGPHLHFGLYRGGAAVNPLKSLK